MEHHPFVNLTDATCITYSDIKKRHDGAEYITLYFETPTEDGFSNMSVDYPGRRPYGVHGYSLQEIDRLLFHYDRVAPVAFDEAKEDEYTYA